MTGALATYLQSLLSLIIGGGIAILSQWVLARQKQDAEARTELNKHRYEAYREIWSWLSRYDRPPVGLESIHCNWNLSHQKYAELDAVITNSIPFLSQRTYSALGNLLKAWKDGLQRWRGGRPLAAVRDLTLAESAATSIDQMVEAVMTACREEVETLFGLGARKA